MNRLKFFIVAFAITVSALGIYSCAKESETKSNSISTHELDLRSRLSEFEKKNGIQLVENWNIATGILAEDDELCKNAYAKKCGENNYTDHSRDILYKDCPIRVNYRLWFCQVEEEDETKTYLSFQILGWQPLARCNKFLKEFSDLYWGGVPGSADDYINEMYKYFSNTIEYSYASWVAELFSIPCNSENSLLNTSFFARDCYKLCIDWTYSDEGELEFGSMIEKQCATSCCLRSREWCYENGEVKILGEKVGGLTCIRPISPEPCSERPGNCSPACNRM